MPEKLAWYSYLDIDPDEELWYLDSITIDKLPIDSQNALKAEVLYSLKGRLHETRDIVKSESKDIMIHDKNIKVVKYIETDASMGKCGQEHVMLLEFVDEQETWYIGASYPISCNIMINDKIVNDTVFTEIINSFEIYDYKYDWDIDLSDSPILGPHSLLYDYEFSIQFDTEEWTIERRDAYKSRYAVSFFSWGANAKLDPFPGINIDDDPKWSLERINPEKFDAGDIPRDHVSEIFWITVQKIDISGQQWIDARASVCDKTNTKVQKYCTNVSHEKSVTINDRPVTITKYVEVQYYPEDGIYNQHHAFLIDLLEEEQTWIVHSTYVYAPSEIIVGDKLLEDIINSFTVMGYKYDWYF